MSEEMKKQAGNRAETLEARQWWLKLVLQPLLFVAGLALFFAALGLGQRIGWLPSASTRQGTAQATGGKNTLYICPMMCTPPRPEPGRCPVCGMELVPSSSAATTEPSDHVHIDPVARRIAGIETVAVKRQPFVHRIRVIGELQYDEGGLKTVAAYVDGRIERLYADYTGVEVKKGDRLALLYSPTLYSGQVELLAAKRAGGGAASLYESARQKLLDLGMTAEQIREVEQRGTAKSRIHLVAPISGTVIEKLAAEGSYVKEGQVIYKVADLSTVWLILRLFPEDAALIRYGQRVDAEVDSLPGHKFHGRVAFIDPNVQAKTRTVGVRVVLDNPDGLLRIGDYARATIAVPLTETGKPPKAIYDPELAKKWISPRHPQVVENSAGKCRVCGMPLVPARSLGFTDDPVAAPTVLVVPRDAILATGDYSIVYVETEPGKFTLRRVVMGPVSGGMAVIRKGLKEGEEIARNGNFLIDSQMQLVGNPSLIDPTKYKPKKPSEEDKIEKALAHLAPQDRKAVLQQVICPVTEFKLGSMGPPIRMEVRGRVVFICCESCRKRILQAPDKFLRKLREPQRPDDSNPASDAQLPVHPSIVPPIPGGPIEAKPQPGREEKP